MRHVIRFGEGEVLELSEAHGCWLAIELSDENVSFTEAMLTKPEQVQEIIDALEEHKVRMLK